MKKNKEPKANRKKLITRMTIFFKDALKKNLISYAETFVLNGYDWLWRILTGYWYQWVMQLKNKFIELI